LQNIYNFNVISEGQQAIEIRKCMAQTYIDTVQGNVITSTEDSTTSKFNKL